MQRELGYVGITIGLLFLFLFLPDNVFENVAGQAGEAVEEEIINQETLYVRANGQTIASLEGGSVEYYHNDYLKSTRAITNQLGQILESNIYNPFGKSKEGEYTGKPKTPTGSVNLGAREYDASTRRFTTPDPILRLANTPYQYAKNNPYKYVDLNGKDDTLLHGTNALAVWLWEETGSIPEGTYFTEIGKPKYAERGVSRNTGKGLETTYATLKAVAKDLGIELPANAEELSRTGVVVALDADLVETKPGHIENPGVRILTQNADVSLAHTQEVVNAPHRGFQTVIQQLDKRVMQSRAIRVSGSAIKVMGNEAFGVAGDVYDMKQGFDNPTSYHQKEAGAKQRAEEMGGVKGGLYYRGWLLLHSFEAIGALNSDVSYGEPAA